MKSYEDFVLDDYFSRVDDGELIYFKLNDDGTFDRVEHTDDQKEVHMITDYQRSLMEHSLGGKDPKKWHRNHFMASPGHTDLPALLELEKHGMMKQVPAPAFCDSDAMLFLVTDLGKQFIADKL